MTAALAIAAVSCTENNPDDPGKDNNGQEEAKALTALDSKTSTWNVDRRLFDLSFSGEGVSVKTQLVGFDAELSAGKYKLVAEASAVAGDAVLEKTLLDSKAVTAGSVTVAKSNKKYTFTFALTADGEEVSLSWSGDIDWPADPAPKAVLTSVLQAQSYAGYGLKQLNVTLGTADLMTTGNGNYLSLDLYTEDAYLHEGIYHVNEVGGVLNEGEFGRAYDTTTQDWTTGEKVDVVYGSTWNSITNWQSTIEKRIEDGIVVVRRVEAGWQISWGKDYPTEYLFEGAIEALTEPEQGDIVEPVLEKTSGLTYTIEDQTATNYADNQNTPLSGVQLFRIQVLEGSDYVAEFDLVVTEGTTDLTGTYEVKSYPHENLTAGNGWGVSAWYMFGGCWYIVEENLFFIPTGSTIKVTDTAGTLKFEFSGNVDTEATQGSTEEFAGEGSLLLDNVTKA